MLILAAALLFAPHYEITLPRFHFGNDAPLPVSDVKGNLYFISDEIGPSGILPQRVTRVDPDGNVVYQAIPVVTGSSCQNRLLIPDSEEDLYVASTCSFGDGKPQLVISKLSPSGTVLYTFPTQISTAVNISGMAVGPDGSVFLTGSAYPKDLATTAGAYVSSVKAAPFNPNAFVVEVNAAGTAIKYATFLDNAPASSSLAPFPSTAGVAIAVDFQGDAYVIGTSDDSGFSTSSFAFNPACNCSIGNASIFLVKLNGDGSNIFYSTFLTSNKGSSAPQSISVNSGLQATITEVRGGGFEFSTTRLDQYGTQLLNYDAVTFDVQGLISLAPVAPDRQGNLLFSGAAAASANLLISAGAFSNGADFVALVRIADGSILYATRLPSGSASGGVLPDGSGGFFVVGATVGNGPIPSTQFTRLVPATSSTPTVLGVANVAGREVSAGLAPGELTSIYGTSLGPRAGLNGKFDSNGHLPESLGGTEVYFNGVRAPLLYAGDQQINAIVPFSVRSQTVSVVVIANSKVSNRAQLPRQVADPEIFKANNAPDPRFAFGVNEDGSINSAQSPAKGGSVLTLFVSGAGLFSPAPKDGTRGGRGPQLVLPVTVNVSFDVSLNHGSPQPVYALGEVLYAGSAPTLAAGVLQINVRLPVEAYVGSSQSILIDFGDLSGPLGPQQAQGAVWIAGK